VGGFVVRDASSELAGNQQRPSNATVAVLSGSVNDHGERTYALSLIFAARMTAIFPFRTVVIDGRMTGTA
jgi:hypothetical protein